MARLGRRHNGRAMPVGGEMECVGNLDLASLHREYERARQDGRRRLADLLRRYQAIEERQRTTLAEALAQVLELDTFSLDTGERVVDLQRVLEQHERSLVVAALACSGGRQKEAARALGILPTTLNEKMKRLRIGPRSSPDRLREPEAPSSLITPSLPETGSQG